MRTRLLILMLMVTGLVACSDSPEHKLGKAQIALRNGQAGEALRLANEVLQDRPGDRIATMIKARSHLRLRQYDLSQSTFRLLIKQSPDDAEIYKELLDLAMAQMSDLLAKSEFSADPKLSDQFTQAKLLGHEQADWFATHRPDGIDADYARARLILLDAERIDRYVNEELARLRTEHLADPAKPLTNESVEEQRRQVISMKAAAEAHLQRVLAIKPDHMRSASLLTWLLADSESWSKLWSLGEQLSKSDHLTAALARDLSNAVMRVPPSIQPTEQRVAMYGKILQAVTPAERQSATWKLAQARFLLLSNQAEEGHQLAQEVMRIQPQDVETRYTVAWSLFSLAKYDQAKAILITLAVDAKQAAQVQSLYGLTLAKLNDRTTAIEVLRRALELNRNDTVARAALIQLLQQDRGSIASSIEHIDKLYRENPTDENAIRFKFVAELAEGDNDKIGQLLASVSRLSPLKPGHLRVMTDGYVYLGQYDKALESATACLEADPSAVSYLALARVRMIRGDVDVARELLTEAKTKFADSPDIDETLATLFLDRGEVDRAIELLKTILEKQPDNGNARLLMATAYTRLAMTEQALAEVNTLLQRDENDPRALQAASSIYRMMGQPELAKSYLEKIDESQLDAARNPGVLAQLKLARGEAVEALAICQRAIAAGNTDPLVRLTIASIHADARNTGEEEVHLLAFVRENPANFVGYQMLISFYARNNLERGIAQFRALRAANEPLARIAEAGLLSAAGRNDEAVNVLSTDFARMVNRKDSFVWPYARTLAALMLRRDGNSRNAVGVLQVLVDRGIKAFHAKLGQLDLRWDELQDADRIRLLEDIRSLFSNDDDSQIDAVLSRYIKMRRPDLALNMVDRLLVDHSNVARYHAMRGELLSTLGRHTDAIAAFSKAIELRPDAEGHYEQLAASQIVLGNYPDAEATYERMGQIDHGALIESLWGRSRLYLMLGLNQQAVDTLNELSRMSRTGDPRVMLAMGKGLMGLHRYDDAYKSLALIPRYAKQYAGAQFLLVRLDQKSRSFERAKDRLEELARDRQTVQDAVDELVSLSMKAGEDAQLLEWSDKVLKLTDLPPVRRAQWLTIRALMQSRSADWAGLEQTLNAAQEISANPAATEAAHIGLLMQLNRLDEARARLAASKNIKDKSIRAMLALAVGEETVPLDPSLAPVPRMLVAIYNGDLDAARSAAESIDSLSTMLYRTDLTAWIDGLTQDTAVRAQASQLALAMAMRDTGLPALAERVAQDIVKAHPHCVPAYVILLTAREDRQAPADEVAKALESVAAESNLCRYVQTLKASKNKDWSRAIDLCKQILAREGQHEGVHYHLASLYRQAGEYDASISELKKLQSYATKLASSVANDLAYRLALYQPQHLDEALKLASSIQKQHPNVPVFADTLAWVLQMRGQSAQALEAIKGTAITFRDNGEVHFHQGVIYEAVGNRRWAEYHLQAAAADEDMPFKAEAVRRLKALSTP